MAMLIERLRSGLWTPEDIIAAADRLEILENAIRDIAARTSENSLSGRISRQALVGQPDDRYRPTVTPLGKRPRAF